MPSWRPVLALTVVAGVAILVLEPGYLDLQAATTPDEFLGVMGDGQSRVMAAAVADIVFALSYGLLGLIAFQHVAVGVLRGLGMGVTIAAATADVVENVFVFVAAQQQRDLGAGTIDAMGSAGSVKFALVSAAIIGLLALAAQRRLDDRR